MKVTVMTQLLPTPRELGQRLTVTNSLELPGYVIVYRLKQDFQYCYADHVEGFGQGKACVSRETYGLKLQGRRKNGTGG